MQKVLAFIKRRKIALIVIVVLVSLALYFFIPRRLSKICINTNVDALSSVSVYCMPNGAEKEEREYIFTEPEDVEAFKELLRSSYVRPKIFNVEYVNGGYEGYDFSLYENSTYNGKNVFLFTSDILTVDGKQFVLYNNDFSTRLREILHN